jgi:hypothetical protein
MNHQKHYRLLFLIAWALATGLAIGLLTASLRVPAFGLAVLILAILASLYAAFMIRQRGHGQGLPPDHTSQQPQQNTVGQLLWGCAVQHYLNERHEAFTLTAIRRPRRELRDLANALGLIKADADEIAGGASRAKHIKLEVEGLAAGAVRELLRLAALIQEARREQQVETR